MRAKHFSTILILRTLAAVAVVMGIALMIETGRHWVISDMADIVGPYSQVGVTTLTIGQRYANAAIGLVANSFLLAFSSGSPSRCSSMLAKAASRRWPVATSSPA